MDVSAMAIAKHLDFDVTRALHVFLNQHRVVAKAAARFALARGQSVGESLQLCCTMRMPLPPPPALALISTGIANALRLLLANKAGA
jgi:hypothetical protein